MRRETTFSPCRTYRYALWREFGGLLDDSRYVMFIGLNPSTADETNDDPTIRRCIGYAKAWGYNALCVTNLFAFRATDPTVMLNADDPVGPDNDSHLVKLAGGADMIVAAWGNDGSHRERDRIVRELLPGLHCLALTRAGQPAHPLYLKGSLRPKPL
ncbi:conserved hypothetical protein [Paraburkholderia ribeironis]|uniref:DUF1643 domain-containing protein n=1 Tax=Paraburkholderia ribeironis TaxID=1247936 RepID=A0A1N7SG96_9BURK|nr:DUF1643 domain-containing protein [Paraburkholderia ribeironis]SIT46428.1 conserved hypothetical protein [Paraburkholderia ribeironis]